MFEDKTKILIVRLSSIGDIILSTPIIRQVRNKFPQAQIDFLIDDKFHSILKYNPHINNLIRYNKSLSSKELKADRDNYLENNIGKYDIVIDLHNNFRTISWRNGVFHKLFKISNYRFSKLSLVYLKKPIVDKHIVEKYFEPLIELDVYEDKLGLEFWLEEDNKDVYFENLKQITSLKKIGIAPGAHHFTKRFPKEKFINLINTYFKNYDINIFGGKDDIDVCEEIASKTNAANLCNLYDLQGTAKAINDIDLMITNDTGLMHIAAARGKKIIALFGSTVREFGFSPYGVDFEMVEKQLPCRPCTHIGRSKCLKKHFNCMNLINEKEIYEAFEKLNMV